MIAEKIRPASRSCGLRGLWKIAMPAALAGAAVLNHIAPDSAWSSFRYLALAFVGGIWATAATRGRWRNAFLSLASVLFCTSALTAYSVIADPSPIDISPPGYRVSRPVIGWGPEHPGVFHVSKIDGRSGRFIFDVDYTIDDHLTRKVVSAAGGPVVAFFGDSMTFGVGLPDDQTLPQLFADETGRRVRVVNLAISGFGPQQFLRALETGLYDDLLTPALSIVYLTTPWHAERSACLRGFMFQAPRYELIGGQPQFAGICGDTWSNRLQLLLSLIPAGHLEAQLGRADRGAIDLYIAILTRAKELGREKYGARTIILYLRNPAYTAQIRVSDDEIMRRLRGLTVIDATLNAAAFPGQNIYIPGDGHPTGVANRARALMLRQNLGDLLPPASSQ
jgi:hypothetical protein